jgi:hypothetical protein
MKSYTMTIRITKADHVRLVQYAKDEEMRLAYFMRKLLNNGLRAEQLPSLEPLSDAGRPKGRGPATLLIHGSNLTVAQRQQIYARFPADYLTEARREYLDREYIHTHAFYYRNGILLTEGHPPVARG